jgi:hypothetical protein
MSYALPCSFCGRSGSAQIQSGYKNTKCGSKAKGRGSQTRWTAPAPRRYAADIYGVHRASFTVVFGNGIHKRANFLVNNQPVAVPEPEMWVMLVVCIPVLLVLARIMVRD